MRKQGRLLVPMWEKAGGNQWIIKMFLANCTKRLPLGRFGVVGAADI